MDRETSLLRGCVSEERSMERLISSLPERGHDKPLSGALRADGWEYLTFDA